MKKTFLLAITLLSTPSFAQCNFGDKKIEVGDSIWVEVPEYVERISNAYKEKGFTDEQIKARLKNSDHTGHRLYCIKSYKLANPSAKTTDKILAIESYTLIDRNPYSPLNKK